jgi:hypothetical protein
VDGMSLTSDIISSVDRLEARRKDSTAEDNPIIAIITPEWYYSNCEEILKGVSIDWPSLDHFFRERFSYNIDEFDPKNYKDEFEGTFSFWYQSYHYQPRQSWGMHLRYDSLIRTAKKFYQDGNLLISNSRDPLIASFFYFFTHGLYHYIFENSVSMLEILLERPRLYKQYLSKMYEGSFNSPACLEESLANRYLYDRSERFKLEKTYLHDILSSQEFSYKDFKKYDEVEFAKANRRLLFQVLYGYNDTLPVQPLEQIMNFLDQGLYGHKIPIWLHYSAQEVY